MLSQCWCCSRAYINNRNVVRIPVQLFYFFSKKKRYTPFFWYYIKKQFLYCKKTDVLSQCWCCGRAYVNNRNMVRIPVRIFYFCPKKKKVYESENEDGYKLIRCTLTGNQGIPAISGQSLSKY